MQNQQLMHNANFSMWSGKLSRKACPAGRQVLRAEQRERGGGTKLTTSPIFFVFSVPFFSMCVCRSVITPAAWTLWFFFSFSLCHLCLISLTPPEIILKSPLLPHRCSSLHNVLHLLFDHTCVPTLLYNSVHCTFYQKNSLSWASSFTDSFTGIEVLNCIRFVFFW